MCQGESCLTILSERVDCQKERYTHPHGLFDYSNFIIDFHSGSEILQANSFCSGLLSQTQSLVSISVSSCGSNTYTYTHCHTHTHTHMHTVTHTHARTQSFTYTYTHTCVHPHTCTHAHTHTVTEISNQKIFS